MLHRPLSLTTRWVFSVQFSTKDVRSAISQWKTEENQRNASDIIIPPSLIHMVQILCSFHRYFACLPGSALASWRLTRWPAEFQPMQSTLGSPKQQNKVKAHVGRSCVGAVRLSWARVLLKGKKTRPKSSPAGFILQVLLCTSVSFSTPSLANQQTPVFTSIFFLIHVLTCKLNVSKHFLFVSLTLTSFMHQKNRVFIFVGAR